MKKYLVIMSGLIFCGQIIWILSSNEYLVSDEQEAAHIPAFSLPSLFDQTKNISHSDIKSKNIRVINFFASWCGPCKIEHPLLMKLTEKEIPILGINFQDKQKSAQKFLMETGNPYLLTAWDKRGAVGSSWGIMSIPQTFVVDEQGKILFHKSGRLHPEDIPNHILPLFEES